MWGVEVSETYQRGSIRKVKRAKGKQVWEWRYRVRGVMKQQTFDATEFPTQKAVWAHLATRIRLLNEGDAMPVPQAATMAQLISKYVDAYLPQLAKSTQDTDGSMLQRHFEPRWGETLVADVHPEDVEGWIKGLVREDGEPMSGASKGRARRLMRQLVDRAMFWRMLPLGENPIKLVKVACAYRLGVDRLVLSVACTFYIRKLIPHHRTESLVSLHCRCQPVVRFLPKLASLFNVRAAKPDHISKALQNSEVPRSICAVFI